MSERYTIHGDASRSPLRITFRGHWDVETVREYKKAPLRVVGAMIAKGSRSGDFRARWSFVPTAK